jgi:hypothetical protein
MIHIFSFSNQGSILNVSPCPDSPYVFTLGGEKQSLQVFDISQSAPGM